jgi:hypothetical protein
VRDQVTLRVCGVTKTVADCFKLRNRVEFDVALQELTEARASRKVCADELWHCAKVCR